MGTDNRWTRESGLCPGRVWTRLLQLQKAKHDGELAHAAVGIVSAVLARSD